jgi:hypothetical protein
MNTLKTDYKNDIFTGPRKYQKTDNTDGTISLNDVTTYEVTGDVYAAADINATNQAVNEFYGEFNAAVNKLTNVLEMTLPAANWNSTAPFIQTITMPMIKETDKPTPGIIYPNPLTESLKAQIEKSSNMITDIETLNGAVKVTCQFKKPVADMIISLKGV